MDKCLDNRCVYSKSMNQPYPRLCIVCQNPEERLFELIPHEESDLDRLKFLMSPLLNYFQMLKEKYPYEDSWLRKLRQESLDNLGEIKSLIEKLQ